MAFPIVARYFVNFRNSDTGLTLTGTFKRADTFAGVGTPTFFEVSNGEYYFDYTWTTSSDPDITFVIDGGASIPTEEVRYIKGVISPRDRFIDIPLSEVPAAVWNDNAVYAAGKKGKRVDDIGAPTDTSATATVFGKTLLYKENVKGADDRSITDVAGSGFVGGTDSLKVISDNVDAINIETDAASIANAVWDTTLSSHTTTGSTGQALQLNDSGLVQSGASTTVTLRAGASAITDFYKNGLVTITSGTGVGQSRSITAYNGATKIATVDRAWGVNPIGGDGYSILPTPPFSSLTATSIADAVWDEPLAGHLSAGSTGEALNSSGSGVSFSSNGDTINPILFSVASPKHTQVKVTYSEPVVMTAGANGALNLANYSIAGLTISAIAQLTSQAVMLTTSSQTPNFLYTLVVTNVEDLVGNPIA